MHREWLHNGSLRIWLTDEEAVKLGIDLEDDSLSMDELSPLKTAISHLLSEALEERPRLVDCSWEVEALPLLDGCLLLCTPKKSRTARRRTRPRGPFILRLHDAEQLFLLVDGFRRCPQRAPVADSALYLLGDEYRLLVYPVSGGGLPPFFREFATPVGEGDALAAVVAEHGKPLVCEQALTHLAAL